MTETFTLGSVTTKFHPLNGTFQYLRVCVPTQDPRVVIVALDRPRQRNAINTSLWKEIGQVFRTLGTTGDGCRCIVLTGVGPSFSSGIDIKDPSFFPQPTTDDQALDVAHRGIAFLPKIKEMQQCFTSVEENPVPVIAALHGSCIGAGVDIASCCDVRLCQSDTQFSIREVKVGLAADVGTLQRFPKIVGNDSRARELCLTGEVFDAQEALRIGFVSSIANDVLQTSIKLGTMIASNSPVAVYGTKKSLVYSRDHTVAEGLDHIASHNALALMTEDVPSAFMASAQKTTAEYSDLPLFSRL
jgi:Delta3,5-Delta2,4-dienoyl-CoA isomerase